MRVAVRPSATSVCARPASARACIDGTRLYSRIIQAVASQPLRRATSPATVINMPSRRARASPRSTMRSNNSPTRTDSTSSDPTHTGLPQPQSPQPT